MTDAIAPIPAEAVEHGEVFTRRWVVDLILDLAGYTSDRDLATLRLVEPACGSGAFLGALVERLSVSLRAHGRGLDEAGDAVRAFDLLTHNVEASRRLVVDTLTAAGWDTADVLPLADKWVAEGDYLLRAPDDGTVDFVVGNPPYIRLEDVPNERTALYREACPTMSGRADIYVGFIEHGLRSLKPGGVLGFIVADRWMRNSYGKRLRAFIAAGYAVDTTVVMHDVDAFEEQVSAYPAISVIRRGHQGPAVVANTTRRFGADDAAAMVAWVGGDTREPVVNDRYEIATLPHWFPGGDLWPTGSPQVLRLIEDLNDRFGPLEDPATGTRIGIGVATGADAVYVTRDPDLAEPERLLPMSMSHETRTGELVPTGHYLVNPWDADGKLVSLREWPRFAAYLETHTKTLRKRNIAARRPDDWYRTIDKVNAGLTGREKLLFPDLKMTTHPVYDGGGLYPHHNLYYVISDKWDLQVLGGLLLSKVAEMTVGAYCVRMRGGTMRFQAQYLRRIRVPHPDTISAKDKKALAAAFQARDAKAATRVAVRVYGLDADTAALLTK